MKTLKKNKWNLLFLLVVFCLTVYGVLKGENLDEIMVVVKHADWKWLLVGAVCVVIFIWGESIIIYYLMKTLSIRLKKWTCFLFSSVGFFFSCITPSASGGQPMQIYYMRKKKIPIPVSTLVLMIVTITYKMVLVVIGIGILIFGQRLVRDYLVGAKSVFYLGILLNVICVAFMILLVFRPMIAKRMIEKGWNILEKLRLLKKREERRTLFEQSMDLYKNTADFYKKNVGVIGKVFFITFLQRIALFLTTYCVYLSFGLSGKSIFDIVLLQAVISVAVDMLPLPGGMGISEKLFLTIFVPIFGSKFLIPGLLLSRGLGYYVQLLLSAIMTVVAQFTLVGEDSISKG